MATRYSKMPPEIAADRRINLTDMRVMIGITKCADRENRAFPSLATIAEYAGLDRRKVPEAIAKLEACGWITRTRRGATSTEYQVIYRDEFSLPIGTWVSPPQVTGDNTEVSPPQVTGDNTEVSPPQVTGDTSTGDTVTPPEVTDCHLHRGSNYLLNNFSNNPEKDSIADAMAPAPVNPKAEAFKSGRRYLTSNGVSERKAGSLLGKWFQENGADAVIAALARAEAETAAEPVAFIFGVLRNGTGTRKAATGPAHRNGWAAVIAGGDIEDL